MTCATPHRRKRFLWNIDLRDFFAFVTEARVVEVFHRVGYPAEAAQYLAKICTLEGQLPQGAPTSPALSNQVLLPVDEKLAVFCRKNKVCYTRYADDLSLSSDSPISQEFQAEVQQILSERGFEVNPKKSRLVGPACQRQVVGLTINRKVSIPRKTRRRIRALFHQFRQDPAAFSERSSELAGLANWVRQFHKREGNAYLKRLQTITTKLSH
jgi:retron-type reverse transcriptase